LAKATGIRARRDFRDAEPSGAAAVGGDHRGARDRDTL